MLAHTTRRQFHHRFSAVAGAFLLLAGLFPAAMSSPAAVRAASPDVVISQVYGGGGNSGATLTNDFIELYNRGTSTVSLAGWSVQYASATGTGNFAATALGGSIGPGQYYLVQEAAGAGGTTPLPTPDASGSIAMSSTSGKIIVANTSTALACNGSSTPCSPSQLAQIVDLVGYGSANFFEGAAAAPGLSNTTAAFRADGGCTDTDHNAADFTAAEASPRNTASPTHSCSAPPATAVINEFSASTTGTDVEYVELFGAPSADLSSLTVVEIEGDITSATGTIDEVITTGTTDADGLFLASLAANALENGTITLLLVRDFSGALTDDLDTDNDGSFDVTPWSEIVDAVAVSDGGAGDLTYGVPALGPNYDGLSSFAPGGASRIPDGLDTDAASDWVRNDFDLAGIPGFAGTAIEGEAINTPGALNQLAEARLAINEIDYDQPSTDTAEFIELKSAGTIGFSLDGVTVELVNGTGGGAAIYQTIALPAVTLAAGDYFVICANAANTPNCDLDVAPDTNLVQNGSPDAVGLRAGGVLIDAVSYEGDTGAPYTEGSGTGLEDDPGLTASIGRCPDGADTDANNVDFVLGSITPGAANQCGGPVLGSCGDAAVAIHEIQGAGLTSPMVGDSVFVEAIVVGDFQNNGMSDSGELNGFYVQEEDADADGDSATSEGIFVFAPGAADVAVGDHVRVLGTVSEFTTSGGSSQTELSSVAGVLVCASGIALPAATEVTLPVSDRSDFEAYEGMLVTFPQALSISEFFNFDRFNEVVLTDGRQYQPTAVAEPGSPEADAVAEANSLGRVTLDDGRSNQNPDPLFHPDGDTFTLDHRFRGGDTVANVTGVIDETFGLYRIQPVADADYTETNHRPTEPEDVGGSLKVASFNVLNYFTTIDDGVNDICGPAADLECRGADDAAELARQRAKIIAALSAMNADIVGLIEIENNVGDGPTADLVSGLNDVLGAGTYDYVATGAIGTDAIRVAMIYKPASVTPMGAYAILDSTVDPRFDDTRSRPVLAQSFEELATGGLFTLAVNHLKSKGSDCGGAPDDDPQQGNCNGTRTSAAEALVDWLATDPTGSGDVDALIMGDLNAYDKEDPIVAIREGADDAAATNDDFTDLVHQFQGELAYSYLFDGQLGYLDTALASGTIASQVTGATIWHVNADEPDILDYDTSFKPAGQEALYEPNAYRSSDHDPVIVGLDLLAFDFDAFQPPVDGAALNEVKAGSVVPVKFGLGGDYGLDVLFEPPQVFACGDWPSGTSEDARTPGSSTLSFDPFEDQYVFTWKTERRWAGECRTLELTFVDGTRVTASFDFVR